MNHVNEIQDWLRSTSLAGLVIPSTDEFISEFPPAANRRLCWATGFSGSTGVAVVLREKAALFVDGRYLLEAEAESAATGIAVEHTAVKLLARRDWMERFVASRAQIGLDPWLHSMADMAQWRKLSADIGFELKMLDKNPLDDLWLDRSPGHLPLVEYPARYAGESYQYKCAFLVDHVERAGLQALLVADPEDVAWLLNVRAAEEVLKTKVGEWHIVPSSTTRVLVQRDSRITWFVDAGRLDANLLARGSETVSIEPPDALPALLRKAAQQGPIGVNPGSTSAALAMMIEESTQVRADDVVARRRWRKHAAEVAGARHAHIVDAAAVVRLMAWLVRTVPQRTVTELEVAQTVEAMRAEHPGYKGASMPQMCASGPNGAQPHYVSRRETDRALNDHPVFFMDSGGQYLGGSTDNTITLALDAPEAKHIRAHTLVLKGYIALATARFPVGTCGVQLDAFARRALWSEGMDYPTATGHGVGSYLNIHEGPRIGADLTPRCTVPLEPGMIISNEPGYYEKGDFGLRIESHMVVITSSHPGFLEFETISRLPIDPRLVDFGHLSCHEKRWLAEYHRMIFRDLEPLLDPATTAWLRAVVDVFIARAASRSSEALTDV